MPKTKQRVLHGNKQCERLLDELARYKVIAYEFPIQPGSRRYMKHVMFGINEHALMVEAYRLFYAGTELERLLKSAMAIVDLVNRTIILTNVRLKHRRKDLPTEVHDLRVY